MLTFDEYNYLYSGLIKYPMEPSTISAVYDDCPVIAEGMIQFTSESSYRWAGPYPGDYVLLEVSDYSNAKFIKNGRKLLDVWAENEEDKKRQAKFFKKEYHYYPEYPTISHPVKLWMCGNDDTSYSKFYKTRQDALDELELFTSFEPLDFKIIYDFNFVFTN